MTTLIIRINGGKKVNKETTDPPAYKYEKKPNIQRNNEKKIDI